MQARRRAVGLGKCLEDERLLLGWDADAGVGHREVQHGGVAIDRGRLHDDQYFAALGELDGIAHQVGQHLRQPAWIADEQVGHVGADVAGQLEILLLRPQGQRLQRVLHRVAQPEWQAFQLELARLDLREVQDVADDAISELADCEIVRRYSRCSDVSFVRSTRSVMPMMPVIGVRIS